MPESTDKVVVTCALTGVLATRKQCPWVPYTPVEIAEEARRAYEAGAAVVHIHARTDEGGPTFEPAVFARIAEETRKRCPVILNFSTGGAGPMQDRVAHIAQVKPPIGALNMGSMNYAKYSERRKEFVFDFVFENPFRDIAFLLEVMNGAGVKPELECFDVGHTNSVWPLIDKGLLRQPLQFSFIMGVLGGIRASAENLALQAREAPRGSTWEVIGISHEQWLMVGAALSLGGNVRVGLEDNFYLDAAGTQMAGSNGDLVAKAVRMARDMGREPASVDEARRLLSLTP
ncbi:MAG TPA: 3-keto-5-aminohexanoate cleavage protein [Myxococcales bacterium]|nr:3-keto-5-aminohexanoate cleavage protein [Myxococcales bacterium]